MSYEVTEVPEPYSSILDRIFHHKGKGAFLEYHPGKYVFPPSLTFCQKAISEFEVRPDDTWFVSYPRTGSTWCSEMIWLINNDLDFEKAKKELLHVRAPIIEMSAIFFEDWSASFMKQIGNSIEMTKNQPAPRTIRSHLSFHLLPKGIDTVKPKVIYIGRNPKDVCVSYYHHCGLYHGMETTFEEFCELFLAGKVPCGNLFDHMMPFWKRRHEPNFLFLKYEDVRVDLRGAAEKVAKFLGKKIPADAMDALVEHLSFNNMKNNAACNLEDLVKCRVGEKHFEQNGVTLMRKGEIGDWKNMMTAEMAKRFDEFIENHTAGTEMKF